MNNNEINNGFVDILRVEGVNARGYGIIPKIVMQDKRLSQGAKLIYAYFCTFAGAGEIAFPSAKKICTDLGFGTEETFRKHRAYLVKYGYLKITQVRGPEGKFKNNIYTLCQFPEPEIENAENTAFLPSPNFTGTVNLPYPYNTVTVNHGHRETGGIKETIDIKTTINKEEEERQFELRKKLSAITGINFENQTGTEAVQRWAKKYPPEIIYLSAEITALHAQKPNIQYMEQVLQDWEKKGWNTAAKIKDGMARAKDRKRPQSFGVGSSKSKKYEEDAEIYVSPASLERLREATENAEDTERVFAPDHPLS